MKNIENLLLTEKYRPQNINDLVTPKRVRAKLEQGVYQHLLLHGSPGTGKCVIGDSLIEVKNKITGKIETMSIRDFHTML